MSDAPVDPLDALIPIGPPRASPPADRLTLPAAHPSGHSRIAVEQLATQRRSQSGHNPHAAVNAGIKTLKSKGTHGLAAPLSVDEQRRMASTLMRQFFQEAQGQAETGERLNTQGRKNAAVAFGVVTDKVIALRGQVEMPASAPEGADATRPKVLELVRRLASNAGVKPTGENSA